MGTSYSTTLTPHPKPTPLRVSFEDSMVPDFTEDQTPDDGRPVDIHDVTPAPTPAPISTPMVELTNDTVVNTVIQSFILRSNLGFKKYGQTMDRTDLTPQEWANHMQEELMDAILYLERLKRDLASPPRSTTVSSPPEGSDNSTPQNSHRWV